MCWRGRVRDRWASADRAKELRSQPSKRQRTPQAWPAITVCARWTSASADLVPAASRRYARWLQPGSKCVQLKTRRRFRITAAGRRNDAGYKKEFSVFQLRAADQEFSENRELRTKSGRKGRHPVNRF